MISRLTDGTFTGDLFYVNDMDDVTASSSSGEQKRLYDVRNDLCNYYGTEEQIYSNYSEFTPGTPFYLFEAGITYSNPQYMIIRQKSCPVNQYMYVLEYVQEGSGKIETENRTYTIRAGDTYIIKRDYECLYYSDRQSPLKKLWINCAGTLIDSLVSFNRFDDFSEGVISAPVNTETSFQVIHGLCRRAKELGSYELYRQMIHQVVDITASLYYSRGNVAHSDDVLSARIKRLIDASPFYRVRIEDIAAAEHYSERHINRVFGERYGCTPKQYIITKKIETAKDMLAGKNKSIKEISELLGFCDEHHFMNTFKRVTGHSAGTWRDVTNKKEDLT